VRPRNPPRRNLKPQAPEFANAPKPMPLTGRHARLTITQRRQPTIFRLRMPLERSLIKSPLTEVASEIDILCKNHRRANI
jgi:hypothetical protein